MTLCVLALSLQIPVSGFDISNGGLKYSHFFSIAFIFYALNGVRRVDNIGAYFVVLFFIYQLSLSFYLGSSLDSMAMIAFAFYAYLLGVGIAFKGDGFFDAIKTASTIILLSIVVKNTFFIDEFISSGFYGAQVPTLYSGGGNIEATWTMLLTLLVQSKLILGSFAFVVSALYASRAGFLAFLLVYYYSSLMMPAISKVRITCYLLLLLLIAWFVQYILFDNLLFGRVLMIGEEADLKVGRVFIWQQGLELLSNNLLGYGVGLGIEAARAISGVEFHENNFHNIYMQILVDAGLLGFFLYFVILAVHFKSKLNDKRLMSLKFFLFSYLILGVLEFTSLEMYFWFFFGLYGYKVRVNE